MGGRDCAGKGYDAGAVGTVPERDVMLRLTGLFRKGAEYMGGRDYAGKGYDAETDGTKPERDMMQRRT